MSVNWMEALNVAALVIGVGVPVSTLIYNSGKNAQWRHHVDDQFTLIINAEKDCAKKREENEDELCKRIESLEEEKAYQKGLRNGARHEQPGF
jgi:hypothetical protein